MRNKISFFLCLSALVGLRLPRDVLWAVRRRVLVIGP